MDHAISIQQNYYDSLYKQFAYYKMLGERTIEQLDDAQLFTQQSESANSIGTIVKHLWGNMLSRWTDFLTTDGEKTWRERDAEFENDINSRKELLEKWNAGWACLFNALDEARNVDLLRIVYIRNQGHTVLEVFQRQLAHYSHHIGQIVHIGKSLKGVDWVSLSIPKGDSKTYNQEMFSKEKSRGHFTDQFLDRDSE